MSLTEDVPVHDARPPPRGPAGGQPAGAAGVGRAEPRHGPGLDPRRAAHRRAPAPVRRAGPLAARPHRRTVGAADDGGSDVTLEPEATVFTNIAPGSADVVRPWVEALRNVGFAVFAKPKIDDDSDVDSDMLAHIALRRGEGLAAVIVASADGQAFRQPLEDIARDEHPGAGARIPRTCQLGTSVRYLRVRRPGGHPGCVPGTAPTDRPGFAARAGRVAAAVPAAVCAADLSCIAAARCRVTTDSPTLGAEVFAWWGRIGLSVPVHRHRRHGRAVLGSAASTASSLGKHVTQSGFFDDGSESVQASLLADEVYGRDRTSHVVAHHTPPRTAEGHRSAVAEEDHRRAERGQGRAPRPGRRLESATGYPTRRFPAAASPRRTRTGTFVSIPLKGDNDDTDPQQLPGDRARPAEGRRRQYQTGRPEPAGQRVDGHHRQGPEAHGDLALPLVAVVLFFVFGGVGRGRLPVIIGGLTIVGALGILRW